MSSLFVAVLVWPWLLGAYALVLLGTAVLTRVVSFQDWLVSRLATRVGLGVPVDLDARIRERVRRRTVAGSVGGLIGLAVAVAAVFSISRSGLQPVVTNGHFSTLAVIEIYATLAASATGTGAGVAWAALHAESPRPDEPSLARSPAVTVVDYLPPILRVGAWPLVGLTVAAVVMVGLVTGPTPWIIAGAATVAVGVASLTGFEIVSRRIVTKGRPTSGTDELVWDDALRSEALRDILYSPLLAVFLGMLWSLAGSGNGLPAPFALIPGGLCLAGAVLYSFVYRNTRTWYLEELWPGSRRRTPEEEASRIATVHVS
jgi:hypothetical protein